MVGWEYIVQLIVVVDDKEKQDNIYTYLQQQAMDAKTKGLINRWRTVKNSREKFDDPTSFQEEG